MGKEGNMVLHDVFTIPKLTTRRVIAFVVALVLVDSVLVFPCVAAPEISRLAVFPFVNADT